MKNVFMMIAVVALFSFSACGVGSKDVPAKVKSAFSEKFPNASKVKWDMEDAKEWEAEFKMDGKEYSANFNLDGLWLETEYEIEISQIPEAVKASLDSEFAGYKIKEPEVSETAEGILYEFQLKNGEEVLEVAIDAGGKVVSREAKGDEDKD